MQPVSPTGKTRFFVTYSTDRVIGRFYYIVGIQLSKGEKISIANKKKFKFFFIGFLNSCGFHSSNIPRNKLTVKT